MNRQNNAVVFLATLICAAVLSSTWSSAGARPAGARHSTERSVDGAASKFKLDPAKIEDRARKRREADRRRDERMNKLGASICTGCGGPVVPFDPSGGDLSINGRSKPQRR
ncbi:hypothetical protein [Methylobacterium sp. SyP6R]|uniref:hypothetical protein n=1 Tax=Methylobacterium sp. SyP6R TaxID=2718876 RepID=UPI001F2CC0A6|nr:hypothetical protein [Methylobacterium sp. SyP6R]MCF4124981.1 hypothetical protein [Methylobacterium sp. SyP6R]